MSDNPYQSSQPVDESRERMTLRLAYFTICGATAFFGILGGLIGFAIGTLAPGFYRSVFYGGYDPRFEPASVGFGEGFTQGVAGGAVVGLLLVAIFVWRDTRARP